MIKLFFPIAIVALSATAYAEGPVEFRFSYSPGSGLTNGQSMSRGSVAYGQLRAVTDRRVAYARGSASHEGSQTEAGVEDIDVAPNYGNGWKAVPVYENGTRNQLGWMRIPANQRTPHYTAARNWTQPNWPVVAQR